MNPLGIIIFISVIQGILFAGHYFLYSTYRFFFGIEARSFLYLWIFLSLWFLLGSLIGGTGYNRLISWFYTGSVVWLGSLLWQLFACLAAWGIWYAFQPNKKIVIISLLAVAALTTVYGIVHATHITYKQYSIPITNLPAEWNNKKIVLVSDVHCGQVRGPKFSKKVSEAISNLKPDLVLVAGDFFDGPPADYTACAAPFGTITSTHGVYFAHGNHEEFRDAPYTEALRSAGVHVLDNRNELIDGINLIGLNYRTSTRSDVNEIAASMKNRMTPNILLLHSPAQYKAAEDAGMDILTAGHSHKGQMWPGPLITKLVFNGFDYGLNYSGNTAVVTTSGVGTWGPPLRIGTNSELVTITLTRK